MTTQQFFKGLGMAIIAVLMTYLTTTPIEWSMLAVVAVATILDYTGKNLIAVLHSDSPAGSLSWINILSGLLIAVSGMILTSLGTLIVEHVIVWAVVWKMVAYTTGTYLLTTFFAPPYSAKNVRMFVAKGIAA